MVLSKTIASAARLLLVAYGLFSRSAIIVARAEDVGLAWDEEELETESTYNDYTDGLNITSVDGNVVNVNCSDNLRVFTATTDMVLSGRSSLLSLLERKVLKGEFMDIYNGLTTSNCDSFHRKLNVIDFLEQSNSEQTFTIEDSIATNESLGVYESSLIDEWDDGKGRQLQATSNATAAPTNLTEEERFGVTVTYKVTGTCRNCPLSDAGSFLLYDDAFRRRLVNNGVSVTTRMVQVIDSTQQDDKSDCVCVEGVAPKPQAPGVQECVDLMNERIPIVEEELGVLEDLFLEDLIQLDDLSTDVPTVGPTAQPTEEQLWGGSTTTETSRIPPEANIEELKIWGRQGGTRPGNRKLVVSNASVGTHGTITALTIVALVATLAF